LRPANQATLKTNKLFQIYACIPKKYPACKTPWQSPILTARIAEIRRHAREPTTHT
jgi:hypothetical protein